MQRKKQAAHALAVMVAPVRAPAMKTATTGRVQRSAKDSTWAVR